MCHHLPWRGMAMQGTTAQGRYAIYEGIERMAGHPVMALCLFGAGFPIPIGGTDAPLRRSGPDSDRRDHAALALTLLA